MKWIDLITIFRCVFTCYLGVAVGKGFQDLLQTTETIIKITSMFRERALLVLQYVVDEEMKKMRYHDMLRDDIRKFVSISGCRTLEDMIDRAQEQEIELELRTKRKSTPTQTTEGSAKKAKNSDSRSRGHQGWSLDNITSYIFLYKWHIFWGLFFSIHHRPKYVCNDLNKPDLK